MKQQQLQEDTKRLGHIVSNYPRSTDKPVLKKAAANALWSIQTHAILGAVLLLLTSGLRRASLHISVVGWVTQVSNFLAVTAVAAIWMSVWGARRRLGWNGVVTTVVRLVLVLLGFVPFIGFIPLALLHVLNIRQARQLGFPTRSLYLKEKDLVKAVESGKAL